MIIYYNYFFNNFDIQDEWYYENEWMMLLLSASDVFQLQIVAVKGKLGDINARKQKNVDKTTQKQSS